jgi:hypothetical protein
MTPQELRHTGDWNAAFECAMRDEIRAAHGYTGSLAPFATSDVAEVIAISPGENDERSWVGAFRLTDGRFAFVSAWCDYTGWGCSDGGYARLASSLEDLQRLGMGDEDRERLFPGLTAELARREQQGAA